MLLDALLGQTLPLPSRQVYWNIHGHLILYLFVATSVSIFCYGAYQRYKMWLQGKPENRFDGIIGRGWRMGWDTFLQRLVLRELIPGAIHAMIFFGFLVLFIGTCIVILEADLGLPVISTPSYFYWGFTVVLNLFGLAAIGGIFFAFVRRYIVKSAYLDNDGDDFFTLALIMVILLTGYFLQALRLAHDQPWWSLYSFLSYGVAQLFWDANKETLASIHMVTWWTHLVLVMFWVAYLPFSKLWHIFAGATNLFFRSTKHRGIINKLNMEDENAESFGIAKIEDFTWKQLLDSDACIRCGRCQQNCPAKLTDKPLNPKEVIQNIKKQMEDCYALKRKAGAAATAAGGEQAQGTAAEAPAGDAAAEGAGPKNLHGDVISGDVLWSCTTCRACEENCPMGIEHLDAIIGMRQYLTMMESSFPQEVVKVFKGLENNGNYLAFGSNKRFDWAKDVEVKQLCDDPDHEILYYVGCHGSFDDRAIKVVKAVVKLLNAAKVKFRVLGVEEKCCGETARRAGNELLAQTLITGNIETFNGYNVKKIVTACPHCFNTLKNEYPTFGGNYEVYHHSEFIAKLIAEGRLSVKGNGIGSVVFHDSCYLGRYNKIYDAPRQVIKSVQGVELIEAERNHRKGFCCGAGGGRMWMEEHLGKRINEERTDQLLATGAKTFSVACPYCLTMISDGLKARNQEENHKVYDIAEIISSHLSN
jgi:Fe-S oxidoreductase/nitrate reductase gamma subunit